MKKLIILFCLTILISCKTTKHNLPEQPIKVIKEDHLEEVIDYIECECENNNCDIKIMCIENLLQNNTAKDMVCKYNCLYNEEIQKCATNKAKTGDMMAHKVALAMYECQYEKISKSKDQYLLMYPEPLLNLRGEDAFIVQMKYFSLGVNTKISNDVVVSFPFFVVRQKLENIIKSINGSAFRDISDYDNYQKYIRESYNPVKKVNDELDQGRYVAHKVLMEFYVEGRIEFWKYGENPLDPNNIKK